MEAECEPEQLFLGKRLKEMKELLEFSYFLL